MNQLSIFPVNIPVDCLKLYQSIKNQLVNKGEYYRNFFSFNYSPDELQKIKLIPEILQQEFKIKNTSGVWKGYFHIGLRLEGLK